MMAIAHDTLPLAVAVRGRSSAASCARGRARGCRRRRSGRAAAAAAGVVAAAAGPHAPRGGGEGVELSVAASGCTIRPGRSSGARRPCASPASSSSGAPPPPPPPPTFFGKPPRRVAPIPGNPEGSGSGDGAGTCRGRRRTACRGSPAACACTPRRLGLELRLGVSVSLLLGALPFFLLLAHLLLGVAHVPPPRRASLPVGLRDRRRAALRPPITPAIAPPPSRLCFSASRSCGGAAGVRSSR